MNSHLHVVLATVLIFICLTGHSQSILRTPYTTNSQAAADAYVQSVVGGSGSADIVTNLGNGWKTTLHTPTLNGAVQYDSGETNESSTNANFYTDGNTGTPALTANGPVDIDSTLSVDNETNTGSLVVYGEASATNFVSSTYSYTVILGQLQNYTELNGSGQNQYQEQAVGNVLNHNSYGNTFAEGASYNALDNSPENYFGQGSENINITNSPDNWFGEACSGITGTGLDADHFGANVSGCNFGTLLDSTFGSVYSCNFTNWNGSTAQGNIYNSTITGAYSLFLFSGTGDGRWGNGGVSFSSIVTSDVGGGNWQGTNMVDDFLWGDGGNEDQSGTAGKIAFGSTSAMVNDGNTNDLWVNGFHIAGGKGLIALPSNLTYLTVRTNWGSQFYTNNYGSRIFVYADEIVTAAAAVGNNGYQLLYDPTGGHNWQTNCDGTIATVTLSIAGMVNTERLSGPVAAGGCYLWTNITSAAGGTAALKNGYISN